LKFILRHISEFLSWSYLFNTLPLSARPKEKKMSTIVFISASRSSVSTTQGLVSHVARRMSGAGHDTQSLVLRDLPAGPLLAGDTSDQRIAAAVTAVGFADAVVVASPVYQSSYSGLLKVFLDLLPQFAFRGKAVLPLLTGGSTAHVLAVDYALRPVLSSLGASHIAQGWFVPSGHIRPYPDGGVLIDHASLIPLTQLITEFLAEVSSRSSNTPLPARVDQTAGPRVSTIPGTPDLQILHVAPDDPKALELFTGMAVENATRHPDQAPTPPAPGEPRLTGEHVLIAVEAGITIAGGTIHRREDHTAEITSIWTSGRHRRRGLASRMMAELERTARNDDAWSLHLVIGPRHPEAHQLVLTAGYQPVFDQPTDPETPRSRTFTKELQSGSTEPDVAHAPHTANPAADRSQKSSLNRKARASTVLQSPHGNPRASHEALAVAVP
jgi:SsuE family FMN reductase